MVNLTIEIQDKAIQDYLKQVQKNSETLPLSRKPFPRLCILQFREISRRKGQGFQEGNGRSLQILQIKKEVKSANDLILYYR